jgi:hypothetical protein
MLNGSRHPQRSSFQLVGWMRIRSIDEASYSAHFLRSKGITPGSPPKKA